MIEQTEIQNIPNTQDNDRGRSKIKYAWGIFFEVNVNQENPFFVVKLRDFLKEDFPWKTIWDEMTKESRTIAYEFPSVFSEKTFYIFAKIQHGKRL